MTAARVNGLDRALVTRRAQLERLLRGASLGLAAAALAISVASGDAAHRGFWAIYVAPMLAAVPWWVGLRLAAIERIPAAARVLDAVVFFAALLRFIDIGGVPASGHTLFLTHSVITVRRGWWRATAVALMAMTTWFKLRVWHDPRSWIVGILAGVVTGVLARVAEHTHHPAV